MSASIYERLSKLAQKSDATKLLDNVLKPQFGDRVLDFGCGTGNTSIELLRRIGPKGFLVGVDPAEDRISIAKNRLQDVGNAKIIRGSIEEATSFASYDVIVSIQVMHWIPALEHRVTLKGIYDTLKPGGRFGFTTMKREQPGYLYDASVSQYENSYDKFLSALGWSVRPLSDWEALVKEAGFELLYGVEEARQYFFPTDEALLNWWEATCVGHFSAARVLEDREENEKLLRKYGWKKNEPVSTNGIHIDVVAKKP